MSYSLIVWMWSSSETPGRAHEIAQSVGEESPPDCLASFDGEAFLDEVLQSFDQKSIDDHGPIIANVFSDLEVPATWVELDVAWSAADRAAHVIPRLAIKRDLVVFDYQTSTILDPCRPKMFVFTTENRAPVYDPTPAEVEEGLTQLNSTDPSFAILEAANGDYIQAAGNPDEMTVEWRRFEPDSFQHFVGSRGRFGGFGTAKIPSSAGHVTVKKNQVLDMQSINPVFLGFLNGGDVSTILTWDDVSHRFK